MDRRLASIAHGNVPSEGRHCHPTRGILLKLSGKHADRDRHRVKQAPLLEVLAEKAIEDAQLVACAFEMADQPRDGRRLVRDDPSLGAASEDSLDLGLDGAGSLGSVVERDGGPLLTDDDRGLRLPLISIPTSTRSTSGYGPLRSSRSPSTVLRVTPWRILLPRETSET